MYLFSASHGHGTSAWPGSSGAPTECRQGTKSPSAQGVEDGLAHAGHDPHVDGHVGRVGELHADVGDGGAEGAHAEGHHVHGAALHRAPEQLGEGGLHLRRLAPVVGGAGVDLLARADERAVLDPGDVAGVGGGPVAVGPLGVVEAGEGAAVDQQLAEAVVLLLGAVAPLDPVGRGTGPPPRRPSRAAAGWWWWWPCVAVIPSFRRVGAGSLGCPCRPRSRGAAGGPAVAVEVEDDPLALAEHAEDRAGEGVGREVVLASGRCRAPRRPPPYRGRRT